MPIILWSLFLGFMAMGFPIVVRCLFDPKVRIDKGLVTAISLVFIAVILRYIGSGYDWWIGGGFLLGLVLAVVDAWLDAQPTEEPK